mgnify:CR=1 FL=1
MLKNFLDISELKAPELLSIVKYRTNKSLLLGKNIGLLFEKYSTRTRLSFHTAISQLGGNAIDIRLDELNISRDESFKDTFKAMNCYLDGLVYRTNNHQKLINASNYFKKPIINALSDKSHPCQTISDLFTLYEKFSSLDLNILWIGDCNNVLYSLIEAVNLITEINLIICTPTAIASNINIKLKENIKVINDISKESLDDIHCVMTDVFISMNEDDSQNKVNLLKSYTVNAEIMQRTSDKSVFMHCLPAKVGLEVSEEVFEGKKSIVWKQAYNRLIAQKNLFNHLYSTDS